MSSQPILSDKEIKKKMIPKFNKKYNKFYPVKKMENLGFYRGICSKCGTAFWNQDSSRKICGESVCSGGYKFINSSITKKKLDYRETWETYVDIFQQWDYTPIDRYPVIARWYDELYFTAAGINVFQPYITAGIQKPPHQAVLEPQMCLRFNDIENVGITGTHYTAFIMVGQHVFNSKQLGKLYWMPEGIEQIYTFLHSGLTIPKNEITFHEDVWAGGGNYGPCMEFFAGGIELGNQVYIQFDSATLQPLETQVIDMGAGLERWSWITQGVTTSYETTFPNVVNYLYSATGYKPDLNIWNRFMKYGGMLNVDEVDDIRTAWKSIAESLGINFENLRKAILPIRALYAIGDHSRNLLFAIRDGGLPSNVGGGYNLRNILRRCFSLIDEFEFNLDFHKIFEIHATELQGWFPELKEFGSLFDILELEHKRYRKTKNKNRKFIERLIKGKKKKEIELDELIKLYDSKGITPEIIHQVDATIQIPENFYYRVQELHEQQQLKERLKPLISEVPTTKQLFYEDSYASKESFKAIILDIINENWLVLDQTHFYPEGGGQIADTGKINEITVINTQKYNNRIFHQIADPTQFMIGDQVIGQIDWERRYKLMKLHSGTHLVNWGAKKVLGSHIWQAGARKLPDYATLDITHYKNLTADEIQRIEALVNQVISENPIESKISVYSRTEAEKKFGLEIYQGGAIPSTDLRIVSWNDDEACSGTHLKSTQEIGLLKIRKSERIQDGIVRLEYVIGQNAISSMQKSEKIIKQLSTKWKVGLDDLIKEAEKITDEWIARGKEIAQLREKITIWGLEKSLTLKEKNIWIKSTYNDIRLLSSIFAQFLIDNCLKIQEKEKTLFIFTENGLLAASMNPEVNLNLKLQEYADVIKISKKIKLDTVSIEIPYYQAFKLKSNAIKNIEPLIEI